MAVDPGARAGESALAISEQKLDLADRQSDVFELAGVPEDLAKEAMRLAGHKLPVKTKFVRREGAGQ